ncbi:S8 family serine peptidase [Streptomyces sp. NPDC014773]|uniref:S8 family serine peptidase n=1 Tax=Streptomyces sp. NPDC014773 TaxID=3364908 RepID=UPI0036FF0797
MRGRPASGGCRCRGPASGAPLARHGRRPPRLLCGSARLGSGSIAQDGTSMAAPHVAGAAALYKQAHPNAEPEEIYSALLTNSTKDHLTSLSTGSPNRLLNTGGL